MTPPRLLRIVALIIASCLPGPVVAHAARHSQSTVRATQEGEIEARISPEPVQLPVTDADDLRFARLATAQGLSQTRVQQIVQDDQGFIWFGTQYGLDRYDGYKFKVFTHDPARADSLGGVYIRSLFKDHSGCLWIGSDQTLDRFDPKTETLTHYRLQSPGVGEIQAFVTHINQDHAGVMWLATGSGLFALDPATGATRLFQHNASDPRTLASSDVESTLEDSRHRFWVATSGGVDELDRRTGKVKLHVPLDAEPIREIHLYEDHDGRLWLAYTSGIGGGLAAYYPATNLLTRYSMAGKDIRGAAFSGFYAITGDSHGNLWLGTGGMGLLRLGPDRGRFVRYRHSPEDPGSLADDDVSALFVDSEQNIWVGLNSQEPNVFSLRSRQFRHVIHNLGRHSGYETLVHSVYEDRRGNLWIGSSGGLNRLDAQSGAMTFYSTTERGVSTGVVSIAEGPAGDLWLGTVGQGLKRFDPRSGRVVKTYLHDASDPNSLSNDVVMDIRIAAPGRLWLSTWDGFDEFDIATGRFTLQKLDPRLRPQMYYKMARDGRGNLWLGGQSGVTRFNPRDGEFTTYRHADQPGAISSNYVNFPFVDSRDQVWVATQNGLDELKADGSFSAYRESDGLGGNAVSCILEDGAGDLWLSTNKGISRFDPRSRIFTNYSASDGLGDMTGWDACFRSRNGAMFFGGFSGLIAFFPENIVDTPAHVPIRLTDLRINGQTVPIAPAGPLTESILYTSAITLSDAQKNFSVEFAALDFLSSASTRYRYRMDGLDSHWNEVGSDQRVVSYTSLPSGTYVFRAQAAVGRNSWTRPGVTLRIRVLPPWWKSWWFATAIGAVLVMVAGAAYRYRLRSIARQYEMRLDERVRERTRIARELHDTLLQSFQGLLLRFQVAYELLPACPTEAKQDLAGAIDSTVRAIYEGRTAVQGLRAAAGEGDDLAGAIKALAQELAGGRHADQMVLHVDLQGSSRPLHPMVRDEIYQIAGEALRNSRRHAQASAIEVELRYDEQQLRLRVRDNGRGIDPKFLRREGAAGHFGLRGMRERARLIGGKLSIWTAVDSGTEVELTVPAARAYASSPATRLALLLRRFARKSSEVVHE